MNDLPVGQMPPDEFEELMEDFIQKRSGEDDRLPGDVFFELLSRFERADTQRVPIKVRGRVVGGQLMLTVPEGSPLQAEGNRVRWEDGHEVIIELEPATAV